MKTCADCGQTKSLDEFPRHRKYKDGHSHICHVCNRARASRWQKDNPERYKERQRAFVESGKKEESRKKEYVKHRESYIKRMQNWVANNRARHHVHTQNWASHNRDKINGYHKTRKEREDSALGSYTPEEWFALCERFGNVCVSCKEPKPLTVDHVIPLSKGGTNTIDNLQPLCHSCNSRKHDTIKDFRL